VAVSGLIKKDNGTLPTTSALIPTKQGRHLRSELLSGIHFLRRSLDIWQLILWSFVLDIVVFAILSELKPDGLRSFPLNQTLIAAIAVAAFGTLRGSVITFSDLVRTTQMKLSGSKKVLPWLIVITLVPVVEFLIKLSEKGITSSIIFLLVPVVAAFSMFRQVQQRRQQETSYDQDAVLRIEELNKQNFVIAIVPMVCARLAGFVGTLIAVISDNQISMFVMYQALGLVLLANLRPITEQFLIRCVRCAGWASRPFKHYHCCPACSTDFHTDKAKTLRERLSRPGSIVKEEIAANDIRIQNPVIQPDPGQAKKPRRFFEFALSRTISSRRSTNPSPARAKPALTSILRGKG